MCEVGRYRAQKKFPALPAIPSQPGLNCPSPVRPACLGSAGTSVISTVLSEDCHSMLNILWCNLYDLHTHCMDSISSSRCTNSAYSLRSHQLKDNRVIINNTVKVIEDRQGRPFLLRFYKMTFGSTLTCNTVDRCTPSRYCIAQSATCTWRRRIVGDISRLWLLRTKEKGRPCWIIPTRP